MRGEDRTATTSFSPGTLSLFSPPVGQGFLARRATNFSPLPRTSNPISWEGEGRRWKAAPSPPPPPPLVPHRPLLAPRPSLPPRPPPTHFLSPGDLLTGSERLATRV